MARPKKQVKAKEPVRLRFNKLKNGNTSIYLDIYHDGRRSYQFLKLYLVPETDYASKIGRHHRPFVQGKDAVHRLDESVP